MSAHDFDHYLNVLYPQKLEAAAKLLSETKLAKLERLAVRIVYVFDQQVVHLPDGKVGDLIRNILVKLTNEMFAFIGALRAGSLYGAYAHVRALLELHASLHFVFEKRTSTAKRVERFAEFPALSRYVRWKRLARKLEKGEIDQTEFDARNYASPSEITEWNEERVECWRKLSGVKNVNALLKVRSWQNTSISELIADSDSSGTSSLLYEVLCHPTHVSPMAARLTGPGYRLIGYSENMDQVRKAIDGAVSASWYALRVLDGPLEGTLSDALTSEIAALIQKG